MKKLIIIFLMIIIILMTNSKEETLSASNILNNPEDKNAKIVYLMIPNLTTKNFNNYFSNDSDIIGIYPTVNPLYQKKLGDMFYSFNYQSLKININNFLNFYRQKLKKNNFTNDVIAIDYNGVPISKVKVYMTNEQIRNFLKDCFNCTYSFIK